MNTRVRALESLIAIFLLGAVIGAGGALLWVNRDSQTTPATTTTATGSRSWMGRKRDPVRLSELLKLTPEQDAKIHAIYDETRRQSAALSKEMGPKFEALRTQTNNKIAALLNDEQKKIFEEFLRGQQDQSRDRSARGGGREGGDRDDGGPQPQNNPSDPQQSQPPGLGAPQLGPNRSGPQQSQPPGFGNPQQMPRGDGSSSPWRGPSGSQLPPPAGTDKENKVQPLS
jgi:hypothetical protein